MKLKWFEVGPLGESEVLFNKRRRKERQEALTEAVFIFEPHLAEAGLSADDVYTLSGAVEISRWSALPQYKNQRATHMAAAIDGGGFANVFFLTQSDSLNRRSVIDFRPTTLPPGFHLFLRPSLFVLKQEREFQKWLANVQDNPDYLKDDPPGILHYRGMDSDTPLNPLYAGERIKEEWYVPNKR